MKSLNLMMVVLGLLCAGCSKNETNYVKGIESKVDQNVMIEQDCIAAMLEEYNMVEYTGQALGCNLYLTLYNYRNKQYYQIGASCADIVKHAIDCDGNDLCANYDSYSCLYFDSNAQKVGIVGFRE